MIAKDLRRAVRSAIAAPGVRHGLRWFMNAPVVPHALRELAHRKIAKRARFPSRATFAYQTPQGQRLVFQHGGTTNYLYWLHEYEQETTSLFSELAARARVIMDIGSADGIYSVVAAAANSSARILAFEPGVGAARVCARNIELNLPLTKHVELHALALGSADRHATLYVAGETGGTSSLNPEFRVDRVEQDVVVRRGDTLLDELGIDQVDLIKIDTESTEPEVLRGLKNHLETHHPDIICEVLRGRTEGELERVVGELGYKFYWISAAGLVRHDRVTGDPTYRHPNYLFTIRSV